MNHLATLAFPLAIIAALAVAAAPARAGLDNAPTHTRPADVPGQTDLFGPLIEQVAPMMQQIAPIIQKLTPIIKGTTSMKQMEQMMQMADPILSKLMTSDGDGSLDIPNVENLLNGTTRNIQHSRRRNK